MLSEICTYLKCSAVVEVETIFYGKNFFYEWTEYKGFKFKEIQVLSCKSVKGINVVGKYFEILIIVFFLCSVS